MARCELSGKGPVVKNLVSHSNIKTKSRAFPNVQKKQVFSKSLGRLVTLKMAASTIRTMEHKGGFDAFILTQPDQVLSKRALELKGKIKSKLKKRAPKAEAKA